jgi:phage repressor protein C with HTH and peptisase S24 domain
MKKHHLTANAWAGLAGVSEGTIRNFLKGGEHGSDSMSDRVYSLLANAIGETVPALQGEEVAQARASDETVPVRSFIGAGDEIVVLQPDGEPIDWTAAPPGMEGAEATQVRGRSMIPLYHEGDLLFHNRQGLDPSHYIGEVVALQVKGGKRFVKLLQRGSRRGRYTLVSVNPAFPPMEDQQIEWVGPIEWVRKKRRK